MSYRHKGREGERESLMHGFIKVLTKISQILIRSLDSEIEYFRTSPFDIFEKKKK